MPGVIGKAVPSLGVEASLELFLHPFTLERLFKSCSHCLLLLILKKSIGMKRLLRKGREKQQHNQMSPRSAVMQISHMALGSTFHSSAFP